MQNNCFLFIYLQIYVTLIIYKYLDIAKSLKSAIANHIANLRERTKYIIHTNIRTLYIQTSVRIKCNHGFE